MKQKLLRFETDLNDEEDYVRYSLSLLDIISEPAQLTFQRSGRKF